MGYKDVNGFIWIHESVDMSEDPIDYTAILILTRRPVQY